MKQIDSERTRLSKLGPVLHLWKVTISWFGLIIWMIALYGWHQLVFLRIFPNFWTFAAIIAALFFLASFVIYIVILPVEYRFTTSQWWKHTNPLAKEIENMRKEMEEIRRLLEQR